MQENKLVSFYAFLLDEQNRLKRNYALPHDVLEIVLLEYVSKTYLLHEIVDKKMNMHVFDHKLSSGDIESKELRQTVKKIICYSSKRMGLRRYFRIKLLLAKQFHQHLECKDVKLMYLFAAENGYLDIVKFLWKNFNESVDELDIATWVCRSRNVDCMNWVHANCKSAIWSRSLLDDAAKIGSLETVIWLHENRKEGCTTEAMDWAAGNGHLEIVKFLHFNRTEGCTTNAMNWAAGHGHLEVVAWLHENRKEGCTINAMNYAAENGSLETVRWLHENREEGCTSDAMDYAAEIGCLDIVKYLHEHRTEGCTENAMDWAAKNGNLEVVKFLHENRSEGCTSDAMDWAAEHGQLDVVMWLHENRKEGCSTDAMELAAENGHLEAVKWLYANQRQNCGVEGALHIAKLFMREQVVEWLSKRV